ncbi:DUF4247 domain-containing protein [Paenibacillus sp. N1-5-1-14]|uniref:DUF4247 domain-containing protein n=1 Tax=Paenibacillus radicibacter TaxID=2972488 RepID=UPI0021590498|nr:DUF4247 domain-containing protein [Paenibacillus radicibacter]MCR8642085.1 DUF4247 domain-containing protein [Paenibacillus radicibacter]
MARRLLHALKLTLVFSLLLPLLVACGGDPVKDNYPLESVNKQGSQQSYVYRAPDKTVPGVAKEIADQNKPQQISKEDPERMFLVYSDKLYNIQKDPAKPTDTLIEVDNKAYVENNYASDFLQAYITLKILDEVFDFVGDSHARKYRGYTSRDIYKPQTIYKTPTKEEKKQAPPMTVDRKGSVTKRGTNNSTGSSSSSDSNKSTTNIFKKSDEQSKSTPAPNTSKDSTGKVIRRDDKSSTNSSSSTGSSSTSNSSSSSSKSSNSGSSSSSSSKSSGSSSSGGGFKVTEKKPSPPKTSSGSGSVTRRK